MIVQLVWKKGTPRSTGKTAADIEIVECGRMAQSQGRLYFYEQTIEEIRSISEERRQQDFIPAFRSVAEDQLADWSVLEENVALNRHICGRCGAAYWSDEEEPTMKSCNACVVKDLNAKENTDAQA